MTEKRPESYATARHFAPYPRYKDPGVEWLSEIPAHWVVRRTKYLARKIGSGKTPPGGAAAYIDSGIMLIRSQNVHFDGLQLDDVAYIDKDTDRDMASTRLIENDVLLNITGASLGRCCVALLSGFLANVNQHVCIIRPRHDVVDASFLANALASNEVQAQIFNNENGVSRDALNFDQIGNLIVCLPLPQEQRDISAFLDRETAKIDALVAKKERLIELLQEKRTALITQAVTKGLDPNVRMKDSGVEWLGEIPAHWDCLALSRLTMSRCDGPFGSGLKSEHYSGSGVRVVRLQNIGWTHFNDDDRAYIAEEYARELGNHGVVEGDLLIAGLGDESHPVGRACVAPTDIEPAMVKADCFRFRLDDRRILSRFAAYQLSATATAAAGSLATGSTRARMNLSTTAVRKIALPPMTEQTAIVGMLDENAKETDTIIVKIQEVIDYLHELRIALISAAVTGKIDVRETRTDIDR